MRVHMQDGRTPLHVAAINNQAEAIHRLIEAGVDVKDEVTAKWVIEVFVIFRQGEPDFGCGCQRRLTMILVAAPIIFRGCVLGHIGHVEGWGCITHAIYVYIQAGQTLLHWAAKQGETKLIDQLVTSGAHVNAKDKVKGWI